jgi:hypothetical protein
MPGVHLGLAPEGFVDLVLNLVRTGRRRDKDVVRDPDDAAHVPDHPLNLMPLVVLISRPVQRDPAAPHLRIYLALGDLGIPLSTCAIARAMSES